MRIRDVLAASASAMLIAPAWVAPAWSQDTVQGNVFCGGVSEEHRQQEEQFDYSLKVVYAQPDGSYLANVPTRIADANGEVLAEGLCEGPWLLADLPSGQYEITATFEGETKTASVSLDGSGAQEQLITF